MASDSFEIIQKLQNLPPHHFEEFVADVWQEKQGWNTEVMEEGPDMGLDVIGEPPRGGDKTAVQCKRYSSGNKVSSRQIREYAALRQQWSDVTGVTVVTTSTFTTNAEEVADRLDVKLIDGGDLVEIVKAFDAHEILEWYAQGKPRDW